MSYTDDTSDDALWLTISEAAERTGRKIDAMRALVRRGRVPRRKGNRGEWLVQVQVPETLPPAALDADSGGDLDPALDSDLDTLARIEGELAAAREQVAELRDRLEDARIGQARAEAAFEAE